MDKSFWGLRWAECQRAKDGRVAIVHQWPAPDADVLLFRYLPPHPPPSGWALALALRRLSIAQQQTNRGGLRKEKTRPEGRSLAMTRLALFASRSFRSPRCSLERPQRRKVTRTSYVNSRMPRATISFKSPSPAVPGKGNRGLRRRVC